MDRLNNERGSVLVFVTLMAVLLFVMVGMGLDTGQLTYSRATGQSAVDAAALSAVSAIPTGDINEVRSRATVFTTDNTHLDSIANPIKGANVTLMEYDFATGNLKAAADITTANAARVALEASNPYDAGATNSPMKSPLFLTPLLNLFSKGKNTQNVSVSAVAVTTAKPAIPIALWSSACSGGATVPGVKIKQQHPTQNDGDENSCWTTFLDPSSGASDVKDLFQTARTCSGPALSGQIDVGTPIYENKGGQVANYGVVEQFFMTDYPGKCWLIPVISGTGNCNAKNPEKITDWAKICPTGISKQGSHSYIEANVTCNQNLQTGEGSLCFSNRLVRDKLSGM